MSAAFSKAATFLPGMEQLSAAADKGDTVARIQGTVISAVVGGTASVLGGGKFANGAQTGAFSYLFNQLSKGAINYRYRMARGHHYALPKELAHHWKDFLCEEAIDYFASRTIGENLSHKDPSNPHKWNEAHQKYNPAVDRELRSFMLSKGINQDAKMTVRQAVEFETRILRSSIPEIRDFNRSIIDYSMRQPPRGRVRGGREN
jgi:hypothetical protein